MKSLDQDTLKRRPRLFNQSVLFYKFHNYQSQLLKLVLLGGTTLLLINYKPMLQFSIILFSLELLESGICSLQTVSSAISFQAVCPALHQIVKGALTPA